MSESPTLHLHLSPTLYHLHCITYTVSPTPITYTYHLHCITYTVSPTPITYTVSPTLYHLHCITYTVSPTPITFTVFKRLFLGRMSRKNRANDKTGFHPEILCHSKPAYKQISLVMSNSLMPTWDLKGFALSW